MKVSVRKCQYNALSRNQISASLAEAEIANKANKRKDSLTLIFLLPKKPTYYLWLKKKLKRVDVKYK